MLLEEVDQQDGDGVRRETALGLPVQPDQTGPVPEGHPQHPHPPVQLVVVLQQPTGLGSERVVEAELTLEVAVSHKLDGGYLAVELLSHRMEFAEEKR